MKKIWFFIIVAYCIAILGCKKEVSPPQLTLTASSESLQYGESVTVNWEALYANRVSTSFNYAKELTGSYRTTLLKSTIFRVEAFNEDGLSISKFVSIKVAPNQLDPEVILTTHKWTYTACERFMGQKEDGTDIWLPTNISGYYRLFNIIDEHYEDYFDDGQIIDESSEEYIWNTWFLSDKTLTLRWGQDVYSISSLTPEKMVLTKFVGAQLYRYTYIASPRDNF